MSNTGYICIIDTCIIDHFKKMLEAYLLGNNSQVCLGVPFYFASNITMFLLGIKF